MKVTSLDYLILMFFLFQIHVSVIAICDHMVEAKMKQTCFNNFKFKYHFKKIQADK